MFTWLGRSNPNLVLVCLRVRRAKSTWIRMGHLVVVAAVELIDANVISIELIKHK